MKIKLIIIACLILSMEVLISGPQSRPIEIGAVMFADEDLPMGSLGYKLGTYLTIEGMRAENGKVGVRTLLVNTVNGKKVDVPAHLWIDNVESLPGGERIIVRGYESGKMVGIPDEVIEKENLVQPQAGWQFYRYFIITSVVEPVDLQLISYSPVSFRTDKSQDPIDRLVADLSSNPLWMNGIFPLIKLSEKANHEEVLAECFKMIGFDKGHVKDYKIIKIKKVKIRGTLPEDYFAALVDTDLGKKIVLFHYEDFSKSWWTRVYDSE